MIVHEHVAPRTLEFVGYEQRETSICMSVCEDLPGFSIVGVDWDEVETKLERAAVEFLEFSGYEVHSFEVIRDDLVPVPDFKPTHFKASFSGKLAA